MKPKVAVCAEQAGTGSAAEALALRLQLPFYSDPTSTPEDVSHLLQYSAAGLVLQARTMHAPGATLVDFSDATLQYRLRTTGKRQGLGKAVGLDKAAGVKVLDATAGLGRDALVLAHLGCELTLLERNPLVHALLEDGMLRARNDAALAPLLTRMQLWHCEAREHFALIRAGKAPRPQVICLDPMFPPRTKSAGVKKDIALLQVLLGNEEDFPGLLAAALECATHRVVVKRPGSGGREGGAVPPPTFAVPGKAARFDVYVNSSFSSMPR